MCGPQWVIYKVVHFLCCFISQVCGPSWVIYKAVHVLCCLISHLQPWGTRRHKLNRGECRGEEVGGRQGQEEDDEEEVGDSEGEGLRYRHGGCGCVGLVGSVGVWG